tara:strand:+ start:11598 stop:14138 length:2541 start_codon:yes stop_codon:yes gene_type:complete
LKPFGILKPLFLSYNIKLFMLKKVYLYSGFAGFTLLLLSSCSTQKNKMLNRGYHSLNTKYNVLFNGKEALKIGESIIEQAYDDNFFELLEVEPIVINGEQMDQTSIVPGFDRAEEKAVKAIQKHSMNIGNIQRNNKIDEAYLLLGKARYYDRRFFPAMEAFNYLLENYANRKTYVEARIWREKTNIRLRNDQLAIKNLRSLARSITPKSKFHSSANATLSQAFINTRQLDSALYYIKNAALTSKDNRHKGRYYFLTGQLYENLKNPDSALWAFEQVVGLKRKTPREYWINAQIKRLQIKSIRDSIDPVESFVKLSKNYENYVFDHWINRALGIHYFHQNKDSLGEHYLNQSLKSENLDLPTKKANYRDLANFNFDAGEFVFTGAYLDSLLRAIPDGTPSKKRIQRERDNLNVVIKYEKIVQATDSLIYIISLDKESQLDYYQEFIDKKAAEALAKVNTEEKVIFPFFGKPSKANVFYFYNPKLVVQGQQKFLSTWGDRPNSDNWANASSINSIRDQSSGVRKQEKATIESFFVEKPENYVNSLPQTIEEIDSIKKLNQNAYLQLGMIYRESFKNNSLAKARLDHLLKLNPPEETAVPAFYHLFKIYEKHLPKKAKVYFDRIVLKYPDSPYAKILTNPEEFDQTDLQTPENVYQNLVKIYQKGDFDELAEKAESFRVVLSGTIFQPKFDLMMANYDGRLNGKIKWERSLKKVSLKYPGSPEAIKAKEMMDQIKLSDSIEKQKKIYLNYKWIFTFDVNDTASLKKIKNNLEEKLKETSYNHWFLSEDRFDQGQVYLVLHGIRNWRNFNEWKKKLDETDKETYNTNNFVVLSADYKNMLLNKIQLTNEK